MLCNNCLQRTCRKHPLFDHGKRNKEIQQKANGLTSSVTDAINSQISRLKAMQSGTSDQETMDYRQEMEKDRATSSSNSSSNSTTSGHNDKKRKYEALTLSGLNPAAAAIMLSNDDFSDTNSDDYEDDDSSDSSTSSTSKSTKKDKKKDKKKEKKKDKKQKKDKKKDKKKEKKHKKDKKS